MSSLGISKVTKVACIETLLQCIKRGNLYIIADNVQHLDIGCKLAFKLALEGKHPSLYFSFTFSKAQMVARLISLKSGIPVEQLINGQLEHSQYKPLSNEITFFDESPLYIDDTPIFELDEVCSKIRNLCGKNKLEYIIIDGLLPDNCEKQVAIEQTLTTLATELNTAIVIVTKSNLTNQIFDTAK